MASWGSLGHVTVAEPGALSASSARGSTRRSTASRSPRACRPPRTSTPTASSTPSCRPRRSPTILDRALDDPACAAPEGIAAGRRTPSGRPSPDVDDLGRGDPLAAPGPAGRTTAAALRRHRRRPPQRHRAGRARPRAADRARALRRGAVRRSSARTAAARPPTTRWARRRCARPGAGCGWPSELGLPLVTVIDTPGAALSAEAEDGGLAGEIARCLADLVTLDAPTLCLMLGEGNGGGALALLPADRVVAAQHAWLSPLPPEGASRDRAPRPRPRRRDGAGPAGAGDRPAPPRRGRPDRRPRSPMRPTSPRSSAAASARCSSTSSARSWPPGRGRPTSGRGATSDPPPPRCVATPERCVSHIPRVRNVACSPLLGVSGRVAALGGV